MDSRHARCRGKGIFCAFQGGHAVLEHGHGRIAIAGIDEFILGAILEAAGRILGAVIDKPLGEKDGLADLIILGPAGSGVHHSCANMTIIHVGPFPQNQKTPT